MEMKKDFFENGFENDDVVLDTILITIWNEYIEKIGYGEKIFSNEAEFFNDGKFVTPYDAAWAVSIGDWRRTDEYVCFNSKGFLVSFQHWNDKNSPVDVSRLSAWIQTNDKKINCKRYVVNNIPRAIHEALQEG